MRQRCALVADRTWSQSVRVSGPGDQIRSGLSLAHSGSNATTACESETRRGGGVSRYAPMAAVDRFMQLRLADRASPLECVQRAGHVSHWGHVDRHRAVGVLAGRRGVPDEFLDVGVNPRALRHGQHSIRSPRRPSHPSDSGSCTGLGIDRRVPCEGAVATSRLFQIWAQRPCCLP
jgi:hypothetical protein